MFAQRYPEEFDGNVAAAPGFSLPRAAVAEAWDVQVFGGLVKPRDAATFDVQALYKAFSEDDLDLVRSAVLDACDADDGLRDGIVGDVEQCTDAKVIASPQALADYRMAFDFGRDAAKIYAADARFRHSGWDDIGARSADLSAFRKRGGRMIVPHGDSDPVFSLNDTLDWYREVDAGAHGAAASFVRVFPVPGAGSPDRHGRPGFALARPRTADLRLSRHRALQGTGRPGGRFQLRMQAVKSSLMR